MNVECLSTDELTVFEVNSPNPLIRIELNRGDFTVSKYNEATFRDELEKIEISEEDGGILLRKPLGIQEHILGLGEKAYELDRRRISVIMWNTDAFSYGWYTDPLYVTIPFFISIEKGRAKGYFVNSASKVKFDFGVEEYDKARIFVPERSSSLYIIQGPTVEQVLERYSALTGVPALPPKWALGHQISRYSYYPQERVIEIVRGYKEAGVPLSAIYLDIDYMDKRKLFTWDRGKFPDPAKMIRELHSLNVKVVAIVDAGVKADQNYEIFREGIGHYCETPNHEIALGVVWPGLCAFPDFLNKEARNVWKKWIKSFVSESGLDGIWLDMNEPAVFSETRTLDGSTLHKRDDGSFVEHRLAHNAYAYFQSLATYEALNEIEKGEINDSEPFILTRAGYAGIQKFAAVWSGDNLATWENMKLQIPLLLDLSVSGVPFIGCDIGGFVGRSDPELIARFYQTFCLFPLFRNHKSKEGNDQEIYSLPAKYVERIKRAISLRYSLLPYLYSLAVESHLHGHPMVRPLAYEFPDDEEVFHLNDEFMIGKGLLFAPQLERGSQEKEVYLPHGKWGSWHGEPKPFDGKRIITTREEMPLYIREGSIVPTATKIVVWGRAEFTLWKEPKGGIRMNSTGRTLECSERMNSDVEFRNSEFKRAKIDGRATLEASSENGSTFVKAAGSGFQKIEVL